MIIIAQMSLGALLFLDWLVKSGNKLHVLLPKALEFMVCLPHLGITTYSLSFLTPKIGKQ